MPCRLRGWRRYLLSYMDFAKSILPVLDNLGFLSYELEDLVIQIALQHENVKYHHRGRQPHGEQ